VVNHPLKSALLEKIKRLPPEQIAQVEDFVEFLVTKEQRRLAGEALRAMWAAVPAEELTPEIEQEIVEAVRAVRAERRAKREADRADRS
jgi:hypothetical protein